jgi:hypothetical protein
MNLNIDDIRSDLISDDKGFYLVRDFYTQTEVDSYLQHCQNFLKTGPKIHARINTDKIFDYVHPRSHDHVDRTYRIYQYFHNHKIDIIATFLKKAITLRDKIEDIWTTDPVYLSEKNSLQDYAIVTCYNETEGLLPKHRDYSGPAKLPLIQFWVLLSTPEQDYKNGNLVLYTRTGKNYRVEADFGLKPGDAIIFDKTLEHEVEKTDKAPTGAIGRWTVLIGARAERDSALQSCYKRMRYGTIVQSVAKYIK